MQTDAPLVVHSLPPDITAQAWTRLGRRVRASRRELAMSRAKFSRASGVAARVLGTLERGEGRVRAETLARIERALGWAAGTAVAELRGENPGGDEELEVADRPDPA